MAMQGAGYAQTATFVAFLVVCMSMAIVHVIPGQAPVAHFTQFFTSLFAATSKSGLNAHEIEAANEALLELPISEQPDAVLRWASSAFAPGKWVQFTSFGLSGIGITHKIAALGLEHAVPIVSIDTLHLFPSTYELVDKVIAHFGIKDTLHIYQPFNLTSREDFEAKYGSRLWKASPEVYGYLTKVEPTKRALDQLGAVAWVTGRRRSQGGERAQMPLIEIDPSDQRVKINPMANWDHDDVFKFVKDSRLPYNPLHDEGYTSIGDVVSTEKADAAEGERAGRFKGQSNKECGMHLTTDSSSVLKLSKLAERIANGYAWDNKAQLRAVEAGQLLISEDNFEEVMEQTTAPILVEVYAPWCAHCRELELTWLSVGLNVSKTAAPAKPVVARMDGWQNQVPPAYQAGFAGTGFPTVYLVMPPKGGEVREVRMYDGDKIKEEILAWTWAEVAKA